MSNKVSTTNEDVDKYMAAKYDVDDVETFKRLPAGELEAYRQLNRIQMTVHNTNDPFNIL